MELKVDSVLSVHNLRIQIGRQRVVDGLSFDVLCGERVCLLGASGSGKSLAASAILGLLPANVHASGSIRIHGHEVLEIPAARRPRDLRVGMVSQDAFSALNPLTSIGSQLAEPFRRHHGLSSKTARLRAVELLDKMGLPDPERIVRRSPVELSGGQRQRVCIALALACRASLLVADEPTTALDVVTQAQVLGVLRASTEGEIAPALLFITHDLAAATHLCDHAVIIERGRVVERGALDAILDCPQHQFTRELSAAARESFLPAPTASLSPVGR